MNQECPTSVKDTAVEQFREQLGEDPEDRILVTCRDAARLLSLKSWDVAKLCEDGTLRHGRFGKRILIHLTSIRDFAWSATA